MSCSPISAKVLVVARWPLGGIRTYMLYMFSHFPPSCQLVVLAASTREDQALQCDCVTYNAELKLVQTATSRDFLRAVYKDLRRNKYDVILSQGLISSVAVSLANVFFKIPHILTIHGIVEPRYLAGKFGLLKKWVLGWVLSRTTCLYAVSNDILEHLYDQYPCLKTHGPPAIVIPNGIELDVLEQKPPQSINLRNVLNIGPNVFLYGFMGRFMPQKGFDVLIEAVSILQREDTNKPFAIVAIGSGDYLREYQALIRNKGLDGFFHFLPFQQMVHHLYPQIDVVVMPSRWEASGLLAMEALCMGVPLIASDCIGLRETVAGTPARVFISEDVSALAELMRDSLRKKNVEVFQNYIPEARSRFDVQHSSTQLVELICKVLGPDE